MTVSLVLVVKLIELITNAIERGYIVRDFATDLGNTAFVGT